MIWNTWNTASSKPSKNCLLMINLKKILIHVHGKKKSSTETYGWRHAKSTTNKQKRHLHNSNFCESSETCIIEAEFMGQQKKCEELLNKWVKLKRRKKNTFSCLFQCLSTSRNNKTALHIPRLTCITTFKGKTKALLICLLIPFSVMGRHFVHRVQNLDNLLPTLS